MLMKLTLRVNFINILRAKRAIRRFSIVKVWLSNYLVKDVGEKSARKMLMNEIVTWCQFHQR